MKKILFYFKFRQFSPPVFFFTPIFRQIFHVNLIKIDMIVRIRIKYFEIFFFIPLLHPSVSQSEHDFNIISFDVINLTA